MTRGIAVIAFACLTCVPATSATARSTVGDQYDAPVLTKKPVTRSARKVTKAKKAAARPRERRKVAARHHGKSLAGFPQPLVAKVAQLQRACGSRVVSAFRPHARIRGTGRMSNHAIRKAVDMAGNPRCMYAHLKGWPGGYSTDYGRVRHLHLSYNRHKEWGLRFAHGGRGHRYARLSRRSGYGG